MNLSRLIRDQLSELSLKNAQFKVNFQTAPLSETGHDRVVFMISMNPGESLKPLSAVASGGELSRLMLGLKVIFTTVMGISTVIFDEIDTGVSGKVALSIGQKMHELSKSSQVIAVTHLAPVAACADNQYLIEKSIADQRTMTSVSHLDLQGRWRELALISTGSDNESALKAAQELLEIGQRHHGG